MILDDLIALAGLESQTVNVYDVDHATHVLDKLALFQCGGGCRNGWTGHPEHVGKKFLRHCKGIAMGSICADKQPAGKPLFQLVFCVAASRLHCLDELSLHISQSNMMERFAA